jgi:RNA polymerase sigma-70 factor (ECF subfamily)
MKVDDDADRGGRRDVPESAASSSVEFDTIYRTEIPSLTRFFRRRLGSYDEADDLAHEALARLLRVSPATQIATPQAYLRRIATNLLRDRAERASTRLAELSVPLVEGLDHTMDFDQHRVLEGRQELAHYDAVLRQLKPKTLQIFLLSRVDGFTYKEIAGQLSMSVWGVKRQMLKAIAHIDQHRRNR